MRFHQWLSRVVGKRKQSNPISVLKKQTVALSASTMFFFPHPVVDLFSPDVQQVSNNEQRYQWKDMFI